MKKIISVLMVLALALSMTCALTSCGEKCITVAIPADSVNEARAMLLLKANGIIKLREGVGISATLLDIVDNPKNIKFVEVAADQLPAQLEDKNIDFAVINSSYVLASDNVNTSDALAIESSSSAYGNVLAVKAGKENTPEIKALLAALQSQTVKDFINSNYNGAVVSTVNKPTEGYDPTVDYEALAGVTIKIAASPFPHAEILQKVKDILAVKGITLEIIEYTDYVTPNEVVQSEEVHANFFQNVPYLMEFNTEKGTAIVSVGVIHVEPLGIYSAQHKDLSLLK